MKLPLLRHFLAGVGVAALLSGCGEKTYDVDEPHAALETAAENMAFYNFEKAYEIYSAIRPEFEEGSEDWIEATYGLGIAAWQSSPPTPERIQEADGLFKIIAEEYPESRFVQEAWRNRGRIRHVRDYAGDEPDGVAARPFYQHVFETWPDTVEADEAAVRYGSSFLEQMDDPEAQEEGIRFLKDYFAQRPNSPMGSTAYEIMATWAEEQAPERALDLYLKGDELGYVDSNKEGINYWVMAEYAREQERWDVAAEYYRKIIVEKPNSGSAWEAQQMMKQLAKKHPDAVGEIPKLSDFSNLQPRDFTK